MKAETSITGKRQITIPKSLYDDMGLKNTDKLVFSKNEKGEYVVSKKEINTLDECPICSREVLNDDIMVVNKSQKYHLACWSISQDNPSSSEPKHIANKLSEVQLKTLDRVEKTKNEYILEEIKNLKDNEVIIDIPVKLAFMEGKPGIIGMVSDFPSSKIIKCNPLI